MRSFCLFDRSNLAAARSPRLLHLLHRLPETPGCCWGLAALRQGSGSATSGVWHRYVRGLASLRQGSGIATSGPFNCQSKLSPLSLSSDNALSLELNTSAHTWTNLHTHRLDPHITHTHTHITHNRHGDREGDCI